MEPFPDSHRVSESVTRSLSFIAQAAGGPICAPCRHCLSSQASSSPLSPSLRPALSSSATPQPRN